MKKFQKAKKLMTSSFTPLKINGFCTPGVVSEDFNVPESSSVKFEQKTHQKQTQNRWHSNGRFSFGYLKSTPWKINGWNLQTTHYLERKVMENGLNHTTEWHKLSRKPSSVDSSRDLLVSQLEVTTVTFHSQKVTRIDRWFFLSPLDTKSGGSTPTSIDKIVICCANHESDGRFPY